MKLVFEQPSSDIAREGETTKVRETAALAAQIAELRR